MALQAATTLLTLHFLLNDIDSGAMPLKIHRACLWFALESSWLHPEHSSSYNAMSLSEMFEAVYCGIYLFT